MVLKSLANNHLIEFTVLVVETVSIHSNIQTSFQSSKFELEFKLHFSNFKKFELKV